MTLSTAKALAVAVLEGDEDAALVLADLIQENHRESGTRLSPIRVLTQHVDRIRIIIYPFREIDVTTFDREHLMREFRSWLGEPNYPLIVTGIDRVELYELPEPVVHTPPQPPRSILYTPTNPSDVSHPAESESDSDLGMYR